MSTSFAKKYIHAHTPVPTSPQSYFLCNLIVDRNASNKVALREVESEFLQSLGIDTHTHTPCVCVCVRCHIETEYKPSENEHHVVHPAAVVCSCFVLSSAL